MMLNKNKMIVVAFKYNDILYALGTSEFQEAIYRKLVIFFIKGKDPKDFPLQDAFDEVVYVKYHAGLCGFLKNLFYIRKVSWFCDVLSFSNPILLATKYITKLSKAKKILWLEDGLMNYYPLSDIPFNTSRHLKSVVQNILGLNDKIILKKKELVTYLLCPDLAVSYWGTLKHIILEKSMIKSSLLSKMAFLEGKKLFIGQALYNNAQGVSKGYYEDFVNKVIVKYGIDYYVPHYGSSNEMIDCEFLNLNDYHVTFEYIACVYSFTLYSVSSTLLYSTKLINPKISTYMLKMDGVDNNKPILQKTVNGVISC